MYAKKCKWCNEIINVEKQCLFALHMANCESNPNRKDRFYYYSKKYKGIEKSKRVNITQKCPKCGTEFTLRITENFYKKGKYRKFCSRKCANSKKWSNEHKKKLSIACKNSEKVKKANQILTEGRLKARKERKNDGNFICLHCGKPGINKRRRPNQKYHYECWLKASGGIRQGSSRGKSGWYKGYWCDSSYELAFLIYCLEHSIKIQRNTIGFNYNYKGKHHIYYPDFWVNGKLTEIKNYRSELTNVKIKSVTEPIDIYYKDTIKPFLNYVIKKYGNNFTDLYEF